MRTYAHIHKHTLSGSPDIAGALCVVGLWLLMVAVFFGSTGFGHAAAFSADSQSSVVPCPCDEEKAHDEHAGDDGEHAEGEPCDDAGDPCRDECPVGCDDCSCCPGIAVAVLPLPMTPSEASCTSASVLAPVEQPASGVGTGVYRPPRSH